MTVDRRVDLNAVAFGAHASLEVCALDLDDPVMLAADATLTEVAAAMRDAGTSAVLVEAPGGGWSLVTERDLTRALAAGFGGGHGAGEVATPHPVAVGRHTNAVEAVALMLARGFRHAPVVDPDGSVLGILSLNVGLEALLSPAGGPPWLRALRVALRIHNQEVSGR